MAINLNSIPTSNTLEFAVTFLNMNNPVAELRYNQAGTLTISFNSIGVGNGDRLSIYLQETPGDITINPGNLAFVDRSVDGKITLRYGMLNSVQQNIVFRLR